MGTLLGLVVGTREDGFPVGEIVVFVVGTREDGFPVGEIGFFVVGFAVTGAALALDGAAVKVLVGNTLGSLLALGFQVGVLVDFGEGLAVVGFSEGFAVVGFGEGFAVVGFTEGDRLTGGLVIGFEDGDADVAGPTFSTKLGKR